eukprot:Clim_evm26s242 gene=Clim_evmTU26s242
MPADAENIAAVNGSTNDSRQFTLRDADEAQKALEGLRADIASLVEGLAVSIESPEGGLSDTDATAGGAEGSTARATYLIQYETQITRMLQALHTLRVFFNSAAASGTSTPAQQLQQDINALKASIAEMDATLTQHSTQCKAWLESLPHSSS